ncbi:MAG: adenylosuccinate synthase [Methylacidiphilales bacterium]|nr:adenylosuccinate synthase [Candidatus Methylacidiphilales bacterium]
MNTFLVGAQWGDEGKGKIIDVLTETNHVVCRAQGGNNAGHTVEFGSKKYVLHLVPSGILRPACICVIGHGTVIDPVSLAQEIRGLEEKGIKTRGRLFVSDRAHVVMPYHRSLDAGRESAARGKIGTTKRGIGPAYNDKASRVGLRMHDFINETVFREKTGERVKETNELCRLKGWKTVTPASIFKDYLPAARFLAPYVTDTVAMLHDLQRKKKNILFEGAQGTFLDIDCGTYPYVTSSNTTSSGLCTGSGLPPNHVDRVVGVMKAYTTRVGEGPFPAESQAISDMLHAWGREFGATTGRARRCGWLDTVLTRYAAMINGIDELAVTNLDGLDQLPEIKVCVSYKAGSRTLHSPPASIDEFSRCKPVFKTFKGWQQDTSNCRSFGKLPPPARSYLKAIAALTGARLRIVSVGPRRDQTFFL